MVRPALERTLKALKLDYVDLYIIEIPMAFKVSSGTHLQLRTLFLIAVSSGAQNATVFATVDGRMPVLPDTTPRNNANRFGPKFLNCQRPSPAGFGS